jgi:hypothetical protein
LRVIVVLAIPARTDHESLRQLAQRLTWSEFRWVATRAEPALRIRDTDNMLTSNEKCHVRPQTN